MSESSGEMRATHHDPDDGSNRSGSGEELTLRPLQPGDAQLLGEFFERLADEPGSEHFHPHPLTKGFALELSSDADREDEYLIAVEGSRILGYAMLRGWDEGYSVPAFGIAILEERRGKGLGRALLNYALDRARGRGATEVMLKVHPDNLGARRLYESVGFEFAGLAPDGIQLKGVLSLAPSEGRLD